MLKNKKYGSYVYYLKLENNSIKTEISFNSDGYDNSKLRIISINLLGDTAYLQKADTSFSVW